MKKRFVKKLALNRETLRALSNEEAAKLVRGGGSGYEEDTCIKSCQCTHDE